jgi:hypothetical protein
MRRTVCPKDSRWDDRMEAGESEALIFTKVDRPTGGAPRCPEFS